VRYQRVPWLPSMVLPLQKPPQTHVPALPGPALIIPPPVALGLPNI
jgi:hypothetical protein